MNAAPFRRIVLTIMLAGLFALTGVAGIAAGQIDDGYDPGSPAQLSQASLTYLLFDDVFNGEDSEAAAELVSEDAVIQTTFGEYQGPEGLLDYIAFVKRTYPDAVFDVTNVTTRGDTVEVSWVMTATRFILDPVERPIEMNVERTGTATIAVDDLQVASLSLADEEFILTAPESESASADPSAELGLVITGGICANPCP